MKIIFNIFFGVYMFIMYFKCLWVNMLDLIVNNNKKNICFNNYYEIFFYLLFKVNFIDCNVIIDSLFKIWLLKCLYIYLYMYLYKWFMLLYVSIFIVIFWGVIWML